MHQQLRAVIGAGMALFAAGIAAQSVIPPAAQSVIPPAAQTAAPSTAPYSAGTSQSFSLRQAVAEALLRNPNRIRAGHEVAAAGFQRDAAEWGRFPSISVDATTRQPSSQAGGAPSTIARLDQPLYAGGRIDGQIDSARSLLTAAESAEAETNQRLAEQTSAAYVGWIDAAERVEIAAKGVEIFLGLLRYVRQRESQGLATAADVSIASARYGNALSQLSELRGALERARADLAALTLARTFPLGVPVSVPAFAESDATQVERVYVEKSPLVAQRRAESESARAQIDVSRAQMLPRLGLRLEYMEGQGGALVHNSESRAMVVLQFAPEAGLSSYSGTQAARSRLDAALAQLDAADNDVRLRARIHFTDYSAGRVQVGAIEPQVSALESAAASYSRQFEAGRKSWLDVLNTQREVVEARLSLSRARSSRDQSALRLMVNTGSFFPWLETLPK
jgi:adhesin transport system outer membrane protein